MLLKSRRKRVLIGYPVAGGQRVAEQSNAPRVSRFQFGAQRTDSPQAVGCDSVLLPRLIGSVPEDAEVAAVLELPDLLQTPLFYCFVVIGVIGESHERPISRYGDQCRRKLSTREYAELLAEANERQKAKQASGTQ